VERSGPEGHVEESQGGLGEAEESQPVSVGPRPSAVPVDAHLPLGDDVTAFDSY